MKSTADAMIAPGIIMLAAVWYALFNVAHDVDKANARITALEKRVNALEKRPIAYPPDIIVEDWRGRPGLPSRHKLPALRGTASAFKE